MLDIGQSASVEIQASQKWNNTGIRLEAGQEYLLEAVDGWTDWFIPSDADGYASRNPVLSLTEWMRRAPREKWFALMGAIDFDERHLFLIGTRRTLQVNTGGVLTCFANDVAFMYWNNSGAVKLTVTRTR